MLDLSLIHIYNVKAAVYKVLQTFSQRITWVFCSTMVYATKGAPSECQQHWPEYGGRDLQSPEGGGYSDIFIHTMDRSIFLVSKF